MKFLELEGDAYKTIEKLDFNSTSSVRRCLKQSQIYIQCEYPANHETPKSYVTMNDERFCTSWKTSNSKTYVAGPTWFKLESNML